MKEAFSRTELLLGSEAMNTIYNSTVAIFGAGGVGSYVIEALARTGLGNFIVVDRDIVAKSNINRQIIATTQTIGMQKVVAVKNRIEQINPNAVVKLYNTFFLPENSGSIDLKSCDYIVDAVDTVTAKIELAMIAYKNSIPIISSMGTGNKLNPMELQIDDIYNTSVCPLAKVMRKELKKRGIPKLKVLYSKEIPIKVNDNLETLDGKSITGSVSFVPSVAGLIIASEVIKDIVLKNRE